MSLLLCLRCAWGLLGELPDTSDRGTSVLQPWQLCSGGKDALQIYQESLMARLGLDTAQRLADGETASHLEVAPCRGCVCVCVYKREREREHALQSVLFGCVYGCCCGLVHCGQSSGSFNAGAGAFFKSAAITFPLTHFKKSPFCPPPAPSEALVTNALSSQLCFPLRKSQRKPQ